MILNVVVVENDTVVCPSGLKVNIYEVGETSAADKTNQQTAVVVLMTAAATDARTPSKVHALLTTSVKPLPVRVTAVPAPFNKPGDALTGVNKVAVGRF
jgi:hypothetical protein